MPSSSQADPTLALVTQILTYYGYSFMLIFGNIGNILNIVLFLQKKLRKTSCNNYFLASAFTNLIALNVGISSLIYAEMRPAGLTEIYCKIEGYIMNVCLQISRFLIVTASFDRYALCSTRAALRKFSRVRVARRYAIPSIILLLLIVPIHVPISVTVVKNTCTFVGTEALYNSIYSLVLIGTIPPGLMFLFSLLIFRNLKLRQQRRQIHPLVVNSSAPPIPANRRLKSRDQQVFAMLLVQVAAYVASSTPYTITLLYVVFNTMKITDQTTENRSTITFILFITDMLRFVCPFTSFYLFISVSRLYRHEMVAIIRRIYSRFSLLWKRNDDIRHNTVVTDYSMTARQAELRH